MSEEIVWLPDRPFPSGWEQDPRKDTCAHQWEYVYAEWRPGHFAEVGRCTACGTPRCDRLDDGQCVERRHHDGLHIFPGGSFDPVGGYLRDEEETRG